MKSLAAAGARATSAWTASSRRPWAAGKAGWRCALLALAGGQAVPADVLVDTLWGDAPPAKPEDQLAVLISRLRSVLGRDRIQHRDRGYLLGCDWLDASELAALTERDGPQARGAGNVLGAAAAARVALSLLRGYGLPPLPGEWAQLRLAELDRLASRARRVAAARAAGGRRLDGRRRRRGGRGVARPLRRGVAAGPAARLRRGRPGGRRAGRLRPGPGTAGRRAGHRPVAGDRRPCTPPSCAASCRPAAAAPPAPARGPGRTAAGPGRPGRRAGLPRRHRRAGPRRRRPRSSWSTARRASGRPRCCAPGPPGGPRPGTSCCWPPAGQLDRAMPLDALLTALAGAAAPARARRRRRPAGPGRADAGGGARAGARAGLAPRPGPGGSSRAPGRSWPTACSAPRCCTRRWSGCWPGWPSGARWPWSSTTRTWPARPGQLAGFARRASLPAVVVAAVRPGEGLPLPATACVHLGLLGREAAAELVGPARADELYERSQGHPLFLTELAQQAAGTELPASLVESVSARCDELGPAGMPCCARPR